MKKLYAVDYRNMHNAIHGLLIFKQYKKATQAAKELQRLWKYSDNADVNEFIYNDEIDKAFATADDHMEEINFRDINAANVYMVDDVPIFIINNCAIDLYL